MRAGRQSGDNIKSQTLIQTLADLVFFFPISVYPSSREPATFALFKGGKIQTKATTCSVKEKRETSPPVNTQHPISDQTPNWTEVMNKLREQVTLGQNKEKNSPYLFWMHQNYKVRKKARLFRDTTAVRTSKATTSGHRSRPSLPVSKSHDCTSCITISPSHRANKHRQQSTCTSWTSASSSSCERWSQRHVSITKAETKQKPLGT